MVGSSDDTSLTAATLVERLTDALGHADILRPELQATILEIAHDVAHGAERKAAPLSAFVLGRYLEIEKARGQSESDALETFRHALDEVLSAPTASP